MSALRVNVVRDNIVIGRLRVESIACNAGASFYQALSKYLRGSFQVAYTSKQRNNTFNILRVLY